MSEAIIKACNTIASVKNTGKECDTAMLATAMIIAIDPSVEFDEDDLSDPVNWMIGLIHDRKAFPIFGQKAPIRSITNADSGDVTITMDDGTLIFVRYGVYNRTFATTNGGLCYAQSLQSFNSSGYSFLEIDKTGQMLARKSATKGKYAGMITDSMFAPSPILANLRDAVYQNRFQLSFSPEEMVKNGVIFKNASALLSLMGLIDAEITEAAAGSTTKLIISVKTECAGTDLVSLFDPELADVDNFIVIDKETKATVSITSAAIVDGKIELTGAFVTGKTYIVKGSAPAVWKGNLVQGYDASNASVEITIP